MSEDIRLERILRCIKNWLKHTSLQDLIIQKFKNKKMYFNQQDFEFLMRNNTKLTLSQIIYAFHQIKHREGNAMTLGELEYKLNNKNLQKPQKVKLLKFQQTKKVIKVIFQELGINKINNILKQYLNSDLKLNHLSISKFLKDFDLDVDDIKNYSDLIFSKQLSIKPQTFFEINGFHIPSKRLGNQCGYIRKQLSKISASDNSQDLLEPFINKLSDFNPQILNVATKLLKEKKKFIDKCNPKPHHLNCKWNRASDIFKSKKYTLFSEKEIKNNNLTKCSFSQMIESKDVLQGSIGDCYFLAAISSLARSYPYLIYKLFVLLQNPAEIYAVRLFINGDWQIFITDTHFPVRSQHQFLYSSSSKNKIYVQLLEKIWAKACGSYSRIQSGYNSEGLNALTGAPCQKIKCRNSILSHRLNFYLNEKKYLLTTSTRYISKAVEQNYGIYKFHSYSIQKIIKIGDTTLIKLRNPWGDKRVWKGRWSFNSNTWTILYRKKCQFEIDPKDGSFFMDFTNFLEYFPDTTVCYLSQYKVNSTIKISVKKKIMVKKDLVIQTAGQYTLSIYQPLQRNKGSGYGNCMLFIYQMNVRKRPEKVFVEQNSHNLDFILEPGQYCAHIKVNWLTREEGDVNLTSYGVDTVLFKS